ncbi:MAG TPA: hypothetical protein VGK79_11460 [Gaiellaceae bacterium]
MSREQLAGLEESDLDLAVTLAWLVRDEVGIEEAERNAATRRAMLVLAAGGDPHRDLEPGDVAAERLAAELDAPARRTALAAALAALDTSGLPRVTAAVEHLRADPDAAWLALALALLADEIAD